MDLAGLWRARRWVAILGYIDQLPGTSRTRAAVAGDREMALLALEHGDADSGEKWSPPLTEWDMHAELLAQMSDRLAEVIKVLAAIKSGVPVVQQDRLKSPPRINTQPFPRPVTAFEKVREEAAKAAAEQLIEWFFPHAKRR